jgi:PAS domain S-box-containing protein
VGGDPSLGILGLNTLQAERDWPDALVKRLQLVAQIFANALARQRHDQKLLESQARLAASADLAGLAFYEVDFENGVAHVDDRFRDLCGVPADREQGLQVLTFWMEQIHPDDRDRILEQRAQLHAGDLERIAVEYRFMHPTQGERWIHHVARVARRDATRRTLKSFGVLRDITQTKHAEEALRDLSRRLIRAHEDERAMLARELHDDVTQRLAVLAIDVGRAELDAPEGAQADVMRSVRAQLVRLSEDIHSLAYQLHPSVLEELGLVEALRAECERRARLGRLAVAMDLESLPAMAGKEAELCLFRVAQEALNNVARHSGTNVASVTLRQADGGLLLAVRDDGVGFDAANPKQGPSLGLMSMRERVHLVNGTLDIETASGRGTMLVAWVPALGGEGHEP